MKYYLAIDQGTHASRACLFDETGVLVRKYTKDIKLNRISSSHVEQDANEIVNSVKEVVAELLHSVNVQQEIVACGIAVQRSSVVAWLNDGTSMSPLLSWQDTRGKQQLAGLRKYKNEIQQLSGLPLSAHYGATKLHYLLDKTKHKTPSLTSLRLSPLISYLLFHLLEESPYIVDHSNAQRTQLFSLENMNWSARLAELFDVPQQLLPVCVPVLKYHGKLAGTNIPVCAVSGDQNAAIFGGGLLTPKTALVNFGTGAFVLHLLDQYRVSEHQLTGIACSSNKLIQYAREATINGAASALSWLENKHQLSNIWEQLPAWLNSIEQPPVFINTIGGLGSPWWRSDIEAFFIADTPVNKPADTLSAQAVAIIESIVFMVCVNLKIMQSEQSISCLRVSGGLSMLDGLCQRLADLAGVKVERMNLAEVTARGAAWLAAGKPDGWSNVKFDVFEPENTPSLNERYTLFNATVERQITNMSSGNNSCPV